MSDLHSATALAGATLVLTRVGDHASALRKRIERAGGRVVCVPGLSLRATPDPAALQRKAEGVMESADALVFTSPTAVRFLFRLLPASSLAPNARIFAIGAGTRRALARHRVAALAPEGRSDSESLLALPELANVHGWRIALVGAAGGRDLLAATLTARGAQVEPLHVYQRAQPHLDRRHFDALAQAADPLVMLVSSAAALANLTELLPADLLARLRAQALVASSARIAALAREKGFIQVGVAASALPDDMLDGAQKALARHRL